MLNDTARAFVTVFGFNTDVSPNDRLSIIPETHEACCDKGCDAVTGTATGIARVARKTQRAQTLTSGYFGGYMVKTQPVGRYELKKCIDKMHMLRERIADRSERDKAIAVARRMATDLEMKGVLREAQAIFNLCVNLRPDDSLFQECLRTSMTVAFCGNAFLQRLELEMDGVGGDLSLRVPPTRRPGLIARNGSAPMVDAYGFRGCDARLRLLSPFEFFMHWGVEAVLPPSDREAQDHSQWLDGGREFRDAHRHDYPPIKLVPGRHYRVKDYAGSDDYIPFPDEAALQTFRHRWILVRHSRPMVPVFVRSRLPGSGRTVEENGRLCSVYLRPWTLNKADASAAVPHLLQLAQIADPALQRPRVPVTRPTGQRIRGKLASQLERGTPSCARSWDWYIHGNVLSDRAARLITRVLTVTLGSKARDDDSGSEEEGNATRDRDEVQPLCPSLENLRVSLSGQDLAVVEAAGSRARQEHVRSIKRGRSAWSSQGLATETPEGFDTAGNMPTLRVKEYGKAARALGKQVGKEELMPFSGASEPHACIYGRVDGDAVEQWLLAMQQTRVEVTLPMGSLGTDVWLSLALEN